MIGKTISHYTIIEKISAGGMGVVYLAEDTRLLRSVALKSLPPNLITDENTRRRFIKEAQTASSLNHPNICVIYDIIEADDSNFIVMELIEGKTLREISNIKGNISEQEVIDIAVKICDALAVVHSNGILHRDINLKIS